MPLPSRVSSAAVNVAHVFTCAGVKSQPSPEDSFSIANADGFMKSRATFVSPTVPLSLP